MGLMKKVFTLIFLFVAAIVFAAEPHVFVINPFIADDNAGYAVVGSKNIYNWGRSHGLFLRLDAGYIRDGYAGYLPAEGRIAFNVTGLKPERQYYLIMDLVTFHNPENGRLPSVLKVFVKGGGYVYKEAACFSFDDMPAAPIMLTIPYEMTQNGGINILLEEYTSSPELLYAHSAWGFWDLIVTDTKDLSGINLPPSLPKMKYKTSISE